MKDWHLCLGPECARDDDFEELNCADPIEESDMSDASLGEDNPGCPLDKYCENGLWEDPCDGEEVHEEYSAEIKIDYTQVDPTGIIE